MDRDQDGKLVHENFAKSTNNLLAFMEKTYKKINYRPIRRIAVLFISIFLPIVFISASAQPNDPYSIEQLIKKLEERNRMYGDESARRATEAARQQFITSGMTPEDIYFSKIRADLVVVARAAIHARLRERGLSEEQSEKLIQELASEFLGCQRESWLLMPGDLRQHILLLTRSAPSIQAAHRMAMEDYKAKFIASGKSESAYTSEVEKWARVYKICTEKSRLKINL